MDKNSLRKQHKEVPQAQSLLKGSGPQISNSNFFQLKKTHNYLILQQVLHNSNSNLLKKSLLSTR
jgi:hypothetical protein